MLNSIFVRTVAALAFTLAISIGAARAAPDRRPDRPVVFIPGMVGSKICERASGKVIWGDRGSLFNFAQLELPVAYDPDKLPHTACGIIHSVAILGPWRVHQYDDLFSTLEKLGFVQ